MAHLLLITLTPDGAPPVQAWAFELAATSQSGWLAGILPQAAQFVRAPARASR